MQFPFTRYSLNFIVKRRHILLDYAFNQSNCPASRVKQLRFPEIS